MARGKVEAVEVVMGRLDLAAVDDLVTEAEEDVLHLAPDLRDQVQVPAPRRLAGQRDVDPLLAQPPVELGALERLAAALECLLEALPERVQGHARLAVAHLAERLRQLCLPPQEADADLLDLVRGRRGGDRLESLVFERRGVHRATIASAS